jgi:hypothetical protein
VHSLSLLSAFCIWLSRNSWAGLGMRRWRDWRAHWVRARRGRREVCWGAGRYPRRPARGMGLGRSGGMALGPSGRNAGRWSGRMLLRLSRWNGCRQASRMVLSGRCRWMIRPGGTG